MDRNIADNLSIGIADKDKVNNPDKGIIDANREDILGIGRVDINKANKLTISIVNPDIIDKLAKDIADVNKIDDPSTGIVNINKSTVEWKTSIADVYRVDNLGTRAKKATASDKLQQSK